MPNSLNRAQVSLEFLIITAVFLVVLLVFFVIGWEQAVFLKTSLQFKDVERNTQLLAQAIEDVYNQGEGSVKVVNVYFPLNTVLNVSQKHFTVTFNNKTFVKTFSMPLQPTTLTFNGKKTLFITFNGQKVIIKEQMFWTDVYSMSKVLNSGDSFTFNITFFNPNNHSIHITLNDILTCTQGVLTPSETGFDVDEGGNHTVSFTFNANTPGQCNWMINATTTNFYTTLFFNFLIQ
jgi:hypothetical protein